MFCACLSTGGGDVRFKFFMTIIGAVKQTNTITLRARGKKLVEKDARTEKSVFSQNYRETPRGSAAHPTFFSLLLLYPCCNHISDARILQSASFIFRWIWGDRQRFFFALFLSERLCTAGNSNRRERGVECAVLNRGLYSQSREPHWTRSKVCLVWNSISSTSTPARSTSGEQRSKTHPTSGLQIIFRSAL